MVPGIMVLINALNFNVRSVLIVEWIFVEINIWQYMLTVNMNRFAEQVW